MRLVRVNPSELTVPQPRDALSRKENLPALFAVLLLLALSCPTVVLAEGVGGGGGTKPPVHCVSPADIENAERGIADYVRRFGSLSVRGREEPSKFAFYPMGGTLYGDLYTTNFVDLDPTAGLLLDWDCTDYTYDGHNASDVVLRTFGEQIIGVPIYAVLDGTVIGTHDGEDDMNSIWCTAPPYPQANWVIIDHGDGRQCRYWHMKKNSVRVSVGQQVRAGEQIGDIGSSGCSTDPHLHFATVDNDTVVEPYAGLCRPGDSEWLDQTPIRRDMYLHDFNITDQDISTYPGMPFDIPRSGTFVVGTQPVYHWIRIANLPASSTWRIRYKTPSGSIQLDSGSNDFWGNPFYRWAWYWFFYWVDLDEVGTWHIVFDVNDNTMVEAPFEVVASVNDIVNRPPNTITVNIEPDSPTTNDVLICRVGTDLVLDDLDYDVVQYHYVWTMDEDVVRDVTTAAYSDAIPHRTATAGSLVRCTVTPTDGTASALPASASVILEAGCPGSSAALAERLALPGSPISKKIRYLSFTAGDAGRTQAVRVTFQNVPAPYAHWTGTQLWVQEPKRYCENAGQKMVPSPNSPPNYGCGASGAISPVWFWGADLGCDAYFGDWTTYGVVHVWNQGLIPLGVYNVQVLDSTCSPDNEGDYSAALTLTQSRWADLIKDCTTNPCGPPDNSTGIVDVTAILDKWKNLPGNVIKARADIEGSPAGDHRLPDQAVNITDVTYCLGAFLGQTYPPPGFPPPGNPPSCP